MSRGLKVTAATDGSDPMLVKGPIEFQKSKDFRNKLELRNDLTQTDGGRYHGNPSQGGDALADSGQVVEERRGPVLLPVRLNLLDGLGDGLQERRQDRLGGRRRHGDDIIK